MISDVAPAISVIDTTMWLPAISRTVASAPARPPASRAAARGSLAESRPVGRAPQPPGERHVDQHVDEHAHDGTAGEQHRAAHGRPAEKPEHARHRHQPHAAVKLLAADDLVDQELRRRRPQHAGKAVHGQDRDRVPDFERVGHEQHAPGERAEHEQHHADLDQAARVVAVGEHARIDREEQERQPVRDHRIAAERGRMELVEDHPVADHVLDRVRHHGERRGDQVDRVVGHAQRREGLVRRVDPAAISAWRCRSRRANSAAGAAAWARSFISRG